MSSEIRESTSGTEETGWKIKSGGEEAGIKVWPSARAVQPSSNLSSSSTSFHPIKGGGICLGVIRSKKIGKL